MLKSIVVAGFLPEIHICSWILAHFRCLDAFKPQVSHEAAVWPGGAGRLPGWKSRIHRIGF